MTVRILLYARSGSLRPLSPHTLTTTSITISASALCSRKVSICCAMTLLSRSRTPGTISRPTPRSFLLRIYPTRFSFTHYPAASASPMSSPIRRGSFSAILNLVGSACRPSVTGYIIISAFSMAQATHKLPPSMSTSKVWVFVEILLTWRLPSAAHSTSPRAMSSAICPT